MPLPQHQLAQLQVDLHVHEHRIQLLKEIIADAQHELAHLTPTQPNHQSRSQSLKDLLTDAQSETALHETILQLGQDAKILAALGEVYDKPELTDQIQSHPEAFLSARGIQLPQGVTVTATRSTPQSAEVVGHYQAGRLQVQMRWLREDGFTSQEIR